MSIEPGFFLAPDAPDQTALWADFELQKAAFLILVAQHEKSSDQVLARLPAYNAFLGYGLDILRSAGPQACRIIGLALLHGHPDTARAEVVLARLWYGILPDERTGELDKRH